MAIAISVSLSGFGWFWVHSYVCCIYFASTRCIIIIYYFGMNEIKFSADSVRTREEENKANRNDTRPERKETKASRNWQSAQRYKTHRNSHNQLNTWRRDWGERGGVIPLTIQFWESWEPGSKKTANKINQQLVTNTRNVSILRKRRRVYILHYEEMEENEISNWTKNWVYASNLELHEEVPCQKDT